MFEVLSSRIDPQEAFLLGLVHDIGRLSVTLMPEDVHEACERLIARGCQSILAELIVFGFDHAESGAEVLKVWNFTPEHIEAIRNHHQPERSEITYRLRSSRHTGARTDSVSQPMSSCC